MLFLEASMVEQNIIKDKKIKRRNGQVLFSLRSRCRWVDNIEMDLLEIESDGVDWTDLAQDRDKWEALVNAIMNVLVP
jgi:hypothetical protein